MFSMIYFAQKIYVSPLKKKTREKLVVCVQDVVKLNSRQSIDSNIELSQKRMTVVLTG